ncbi:MAG: histidine phosphatase family protein [Oscillospiraceae bacterium]
MKMKIYAARHGQTEWNLNDRICGRTDVELTETGRQQALLLAEKAYEKGDIDLIVCSPMKRARDTAQAVADRIGCNIMIDERLIEWDYGDYEGKHRTTEGFAENKTEFGVKMHGGGESVLQLAHRTYSVIDDVIKNYPDKNVLLVCHGGVCRIIETYFNDLTTHDYSNFFMGNCELREYIVPENAKISKN